MEEGGNRWSKPHVATLSLHALFELRSLLLNGTVMLDMEAASLEQIADLVLDNMINKGSLPIEAREKVWMEARDQTLSLSLWLMKCLSASFNEKAI